MTTTTDLKPLRFYLAKTVKRICLDTGFVDTDSPMFVAKWQDLFVIAKDDNNFFFATEAQASEYVRTERDEKNKPKRALNCNSPVILPVSDRFKWTVQCGLTCPDGGDETIFENCVVQNKEAAEALAAQWDGTQVRGARGFLRIRGPAFYEIRRCTPRPAVAPQAPLPAPAVPQSPSVANFQPTARASAGIRRGAIYGWPSSIEERDSPNIFYERSGPRRAANFNVNQRIYEDMLRSVQNFQRQTTVPATPNDQEEFIRFSRRE